MKFIHFCICLILISAAGTLYAAQKESYEDYSADEKVTRDDPLSDSSASDERIYKNLRGSIRDEIDRTISRERREKEEGVDSGRINSDVRKIVREEISSASGTAAKQYLRQWTFEFGGNLDFSTYFDHTESHKKGDVQYDEHGKELYMLNRDKYATGNPFLNVFLHKNIAASFDSIVQYNVTSNKFRYSVGAGPLFVFGLNAAETICFFGGVSLGYHYDRDNPVKYHGLLYSNKAGFKFIFSPGVILNCGVSGTVRSKGIGFNDFYMEVNPFIGISTWL